MDSKFHSRVAQNLCYRCGKQPPAEGQRRCFECVLSDRERNRKHKQRAINAGLCRSCHSRPRVGDKAQCDECLEKHRQHNLKWYAQIRASCIEAYGGKCACCGLKTEKYLQLDHTNGGGSRQRREWVEEGVPLLSNFNWAYNNGFPDILQLLCGNCHQAKTSNKPCLPEDHIWIQMGDVVRY